MYCLRRDLLETLRNSIKQSIFMKYYIQIFIYTVLIVNTVNNFNFFNI